MKRAVCDSVLKYFRGTAAKGVLRKVSKTNYGTVCCLKSVH